MSDANIPPVLAEVTRSGIVESQHRGHMVVLAADGSIQFALGNPNISIFPRSSIKCIQASAMVRAGLKLEPRLLALVAASHSGATMHQDGAREILASVDLDESALLNASDKPLGDEERKQWGAKPATALAHNCSGKHAGMLATCVKNGWSLGNYLEASHPLQVACRQELENLAQEKVSLVSVDGCGAPLFVLSLMGLARTIHAITISTDPVHVSVLRACKQFPEMVAGEGRLTTRKMREIPGLFIKEGAEAVEVGSLPDGRTFVFKIEDGSWRAFGPIVVRILERFGIPSKDEVTPIYGGKEVIGSIRAIF